jgi:electron transport complex protein RnfB
VINYTISLENTWDQHPIPYPATQSGVEIELLKSLFTPEEAEITLILSALFERPEKIYQRLKKIDSTLDDLEKKLLDMLKKGLIRGTRDRKNKEKYLFSKMPMAVGIYEAQVDKINYETARLFEEYEKEAFGDALLKNKTHQLRTIPP